MRKILLVLILLAAMAIAVPAGAQIINTATGLAATIKDNNQNQNTNLNTDVNTNVNTNVFTPINANIQGQQQGQLQGQMQGQGQLQGQANFQNISPSQSVSFNSPTQLLGINVPGMPEINFGNGQFEEATSKFPGFDSGIKKLDIGKDIVVKLVSYCANEKFKGFYGTVLDELKSALKEYKGNAKNLRYQIWRADAQKTITGGVNGSGVGSALSPAGSTGGGGGGVTGISVGGTKAQPLFTIIIVEVKSA